MRRLLFLLLLPLPLFAQTGVVTGVALDTLGNTVAGATITVCPNGSSGIPCSPVTASTTSNGQGAFSVVVPVGTYTVTVFRLGIVATSSTVVVAPSNVTISNNVIYTGNVTFGPGSVTINGGLTATAGPNIETVYNLDTIRYVDGIKYPLTVAGVNQAITDANAAGGGMVMITQPMNVNANIVLQTGVHVQCTGWASAPLTWTGGSGPNSFFFGQNVTDVGVHWCRMIGPNASTSGTSDVRGVELDGTSRHSFTYNKITGVSYGVFEQGFGGNPGNDGVIDHNWIQTATTQGIATFDNKVRITFNSIDTVGTTNLHHGIYASGGKDITVQGNQISNVTGFCVHANTSTSGQNDEITKILGNGCNTTGQAGSGARGGILVGFASAATFNRTAVVEGNVIDTLAGDRGIGVTDATDVWISGNVLRNVGASDCYLINAPTNGIQRFHVDGHCFTSTGGNGVKFVATAAITHGVIGPMVLDTLQQSCVTIPSNVTDVIVSGITCNNYNTSNASNDAFFSNGAKISFVGISATSTQATGFGVDIGSSATDNIVVSNQLFGNGGSFNDAGTRTLSAGNKINNTDAIFRVGPTGIILPGSTSGTVTHVAGGTVTSYTETDPLAAPANANAIKTYTTAGVASFGNTNLTLKKGSGSANYTNATTTYAVVDSTNLCLTVTIPTGWKLSVVASGAYGTATAAALAELALSDNASCSTANAGILTETQVSTLIANPVPATLEWVITGDGNSHNIALQFKTSNASDAATLINNSATFFPTMLFTLMPSN